MLQLNLLPDIKKEFLHAQRQRNLVMTIAILVSVIAGAAVIILWIAMGSLAFIGGGIDGNGGLRGKIADYEKTIKKNQTDKQLNEYLTVQNQLSQIDKLKADIPVYSRLFDYLKQLNPADPNGVELSTVNVSNGGDNGDSNSIELQGSTATFASLDVYKTTLTRTTIGYSVGADGKIVTEPLFSAVAVTSAGLSDNDSGGKKVAFTIKLTYNPAAVAVSSANIMLTVPQETTSDADRNAPRAVFNGEQPTDATDSGNTNAGGAQ